MTDDPNDITPKADYIKALRAHEANYPLLIGEAVDNALDVGATEISVEINTSHVVVSDGGPGVESARQKVFFQLGNHSPTIGGPIGRYGMGMKAQAIAAGSELKVLSTTHSETFAQHVNWNAVMKTGWRLSPPLITAPLSPHTGTQVVVMKLDKPPSGGVIARCREEIINMFFPALERCRITFNGETLAPLGLPEMSQVIECDVEVRPGKGAHVRAGLLAEAGGRQSEVSLVYGHRALRSQCDFGCGDYSGLTSMFALVELYEADGEKWLLQPFKNGLKDRDSDKLEDAIEDAIRPILEQCHAASMDIAADEMAEDLTASLAPELLPARPRKKKLITVKPPPPPPPKPPGPPGIVKDVLPDLEGPARATRAPHMIIEFVKGLHRTHGVGKFEPSRKLSRIQLARDDPWVSYWLGRRDREAAKSALHMAALAVYFYEKDCRQGDIEPFGFRLARLLARQISAARSVG